MMQHAALKCISEQKYDKLINVTIYDKSIASQLLRRYSQYTIVALIRSEALLANQEFLFTFIAGEKNWIRRQNLQNNKKEDEQKKKLAKLQQPTAEAIKEQVSLEVDQQLPKKVVESALKKISKKQKTKGLAHLWLSKKN